MTDQAQQPIKQLYRRLQGLGYPKKYVQGCLPSWWQDDAAGSEAGLQEAMLILSRRLGLKLTTLRGTSELAFKTDTAARYKKNAGSDLDDLRMATQIAMQVGKLVAAAAKPSIRELPVAAAQIRSAVLATGKPWVGFEDLIDYCWSIGVPVVYLPKTAFPADAKRMYGMAAVIEGRPLIILSRHARYAAWLLFILAHELGHLCKRHVQDGFLVDEKVIEETTDTEELEANGFAIEIICGTNLQLGSHRDLNARMLASQAQKFGRQHQIDPGHVALNYAHGENRFAVGQKALEFIEQPIDPALLVNRRLGEHLDWDALPDDEVEFVEKLTGCKRPSDPLRR